MKLALHGHSFHRIPAGHVEAVARHFLERGHELWLSQSLTRPFDRNPRFSFPFHAFALEDGPGPWELFLSLGGDGSLLDSLLYTVPAGIPMLGVHFGRLGFLPNVSAQELARLDPLLESEELPVGHRTLLEISLSENNSFAGQNFALNEISLTKRDSASMITIQTHLNGEFLNDYWGDGLIVSTPTGSTGYSLSCGGPILWPESKGLILTPVSPHNLTMRPIVLPETSVIDLQPRGRQQKIMVSMDSRSRAVTLQQAIRIQVSQSTARFLQVPGSSFPVTLREKLFWGKDLRN